jgi:hypothetical protein
LPQVSSAGLGEVAPPSLTLFLPFSIFVLLVSSALFLSSPHSSNLKAPQSSNPILFLFSLLCLYLDTHDHGHTINQCLCVFLPNL